VRSLVAWLRGWGISIASLVGGLLTLFVFRRGLPHVGWIVGYLLLLWLLVAVLVQARDTLQASDKRAHRLVLTATEYTVQTLYHGVLLFLLPAYWVATTLSSPNALLLVLLAALALLATIDPWYRALVRAWPWFGYVFFVVSMFGALNLALPLVGVPPFAALLIAAWLAVVGLTPAVRRARHWRWITAVVVTTVAGLAAAAAVGRWCVVVPPAPMFLARAKLDWTVGALDSLEPVAGAIRATDLHERGLVARTAIYAPAGLRQPVEHVWRRDGRIINVVRLTPVQGGRREGFRTFSRKTAFPSDSVGRWSVDVTTESGQLIGRLRFRVVP
jgi:MFS family permease